MAPLLVFFFFFAGTNMSREFVPKERKTSSENMCQKSKKQVQRICVKKAKKQIHMNVSKELKGSKVTANRLYMHNYVVETNWNDKWGKRKNSFYFILFY